MPAVPPPSLIICVPLVLAAITAMPLRAQLVAYEGFQDYAGGGVQVESGSNCPATIINSLNDN